MNGFRTVKYPQDTHRGVYARGAYVLRMLVILQLALFRHSHLHFVFVLARDSQGSTAARMHRDAHGH